MDLKGESEPQNSAPGIPKTQTVWAWATLIVLILFIVVNYADRTILALAAVPVMEDLGIDESQLGFISGSFYFLYSIAAVVVGWIATRTGLKWILFAMAVLWALTQLPVFLFAGVGTLLGSRIALGAFEGPAIPMTNSVAFTWFPEDKRGLPSSLINSGSSIAKVAVAPLLVLVIAGFGWRASFLVVALLSLAWAILWFIMGREGPYSAVATSSARGREDDGTQVQLIDPEVRRRNKALFWRTIFGRTFIGYTLAVFPMYGLITVIISWSAAYFEQGLGFGREVSGYLYSLPSVATLIGFFVIGLVSDRLLKIGVSTRLSRGILPMGLLAVTGLLLALVPVAAGGNRWLGIAVLCAAYALGSAAVPITNASVGTIALPHQRANILSIYVAIYSTAGIIAPTVTGWLVEMADTKLEGYDRSFVILGVLMAVCSVVAAVLVHPQKDGDLLKERFSDARAKASEAEAVV